MIHPQHIRPWIDKSWWRSTGLSPPNSHGCCVYTFFPELRYLRLCGVTQVFSKDHNVALNIIFFYFSFHTVFQLGEENAKYVRDRKGDNFSFPLHQGNAVPSLEQNNWPKGLLQRWRWATLYSLGAQPKENGLRSSKKEFY